METTINVKDQERYQIDPKPTHGGAKNGMVAVIIEHGGVRSIKHFCPSHDNCRKELRHALLTGGVMTPRSKKLFGHLNIN